jgi:hypothetical protein
MPPGLYKYRLIIAACLLLLYSTLSGAAVLCHHHHTSSFSTDHPGSGKQSFAITDTKISAPCKLCDHHLASFALPSTETNLQSPGYHFIEVTFFLQTSPSSNRIQLRDCDRGPPVM